GRHSRTSASMRSQSGPRGPFATTPRGPAEPVTDWPTATPMREPPKSKARTVSGRVVSGVPGMRREPADVDAQDARGGHPAFGVRHVEHDFRGGRDAQPGVRQHFGFELARLPAGIAER